jgi:hypothetical protein
MVTQTMLEREIAKVKKAKAEHAGEKGKSRRRIGFLDCCSSFQKQDTHSRMRSA